MTSTVQVAGVSKTLGSNLVLNEVNLTVAAGDVACIIGPSGAGKSTLLRCINGLERADEGLVLVDGQPVGYTERDGALHEMSENELCELRSRIGMVFQRFNVFKQMTAIENVIMAQVIVKNRTKNQARERGLACLADVGLSGKEDRYPSELSGGEQQRVAIARALAMDPSVMLFDEPTSALDAELVGEVLTVMGSLAQQGMTMLVATHELSFAREVANQIAFMDKGRVVEAGPPEDVLTRPSHQRTQTFLSRVRGQLS